MGYLSCLAKKYTKRQKKKAEKIGKANLEQKIAHQSDGLTENERSFGAIEKKNKTNEKTYKRTHFPIVFMSNYQAKLFCFFVSLDLHEIFFTFRIDKKKKNIFLF